jgi:6,7-dimethyl-8-ribityllumazine synthase
MTPEEGEMTRMDDLDRKDDAERAWEREPEPEEIERARENVLDGWPSAKLDDPPEDPVGPVVALGVEAEPAEADVEPLSEAEPQPEAPEVDEPRREPPPAVEASAQHTPGVLSIPPGYPVLEGEARGGRRAVGIVVSRFNGEVTRHLLDGALAELHANGVEAGSITVMPVPGAFELPVAAMALAKTRRFACIVALGCVIRGETPHFDYVAGEAASGLQLAAIETGVPVAFGVLTLDRADQAERRYDKGREAVRTALEMADLFANLRAAAAR